MTIQETLRSHYQRDQWQNILEQVFNKSAQRLSLLSSPSTLAVQHDNVLSTIQLGNIELEDGNSIAVLEIKTTSQTKLAKNRIGLRNFVASFIDQADATAVLAVFHQEDSDDWRLTYASKTTTLDQDTFEVVNITTAPKRFTYLLGKNEPCRTPSARLEKIRDNKSALNLAEVEKAFSVESLSKHFFEKYKEQYIRFVSYLFTEDKVAKTRELFGITEINDDYELAKVNKPVRDFVKTLLGRLVFLTFLQKKSWLGCSAESSDWADGQPDFLQKYLKLATDNDEASIFHSKYLTSLFFDALNNDQRKNDIFHLTGTRIPFLNGGLFEDSEDQARSLDFPKGYFLELFDFFDGYNFTIDENDPEDHEVGIDPEMLGMIFENLLEDNKEKGTYYTPKTIVSYMARQSLLHYLQNHLGKDPELELLLNEKDPANHSTPDSFVRNNANKIAKLLENVKICDPAIGSGAFPIGLLQEILWTRLTLNWELNTTKERAKLKREIIQKSIHGVDLDMGAVEIARLRFWLALIVDEEEPRPLPNLDYKIMQGNSLLESYQGVDLSTVLDEGSRPEHTLTSLISDQVELDLTDTRQQELRVKSTEQKEELLEARRSFFAARKPERKVELRNIIDKKVIQHIRHHLDYQLDSEDTQLHRIRTDWQAKRDTSPKWNPAKAAERKFLALEKHVQTIQSSIQDLDKLQHVAERPFFLWHLLFQDVFKDGGFDIIIANPPYVRHELIKEQKPLLQDEGYECYVGTADLLVYFYEQAHKLLKPDGILTFITSNKFYRAGYGKKLRQFLAEKQTIHTLIDFRDAPVFNNVIAYASIYIGQKHTPPADHQTKALPWDLTKPAATLPQEIKNAFPVSQSSLTPDGWRLVEPRVNNLLEKLKANGTPLGEYVEGRFYRGILTGLNEAFVIDGKKRAELIERDPKSEEVIKPFLRGRDVKRWKVTHEDYWLLFIPWHFPLHEDDTISGSSEKAETAFKKNYPAVFKHLESYKAKLSARNKAETGIRYEWYALQRYGSSYWKEFEEPKIIYPNQCSRAEFTYDTSNYYANQKAFILTGCDQSLVTILNSSVTEFIFPFYLSPLQNGFWEPSKIYVEQFPIPHINDADRKKLITLAEKCAASTLKGDQASLKAYEDEINQIVYRLFNLTTEEINLIEITLAN